MSTGPEELNLETIAPEDADLIDLRYEGVDLPLDENADPTQVDLACGEHLGVVSLEGGYDDESFVDLHVLGEVFRGESAYDAAVRNGFVGTLAQWLESLRGEESPNAAIALAAQAAAEAAADRAEAATLGASDSETSAEGHAAAATTASGQAQAYRDEAGVHAQASLTFKTSAETSAGQALAYRNQAAQSSEDADSAALRAETAEGVSVTMRDQARGFSEASAASSQSAETYMDESRVEAQAARAAHLLAETSRENSLAHSLAAYDSAQEALASSTEAGEYASAALTSRLAAEAARDDTDVAAAAVIIDRDIVIARADEAGEYAEAAEAHRVAALTSAGAASVSATNSAISETNAESSRVAAEAARDIAVASSEDAEDALAATISYRDQAEIFSDQSGDYATAAASSATSASTSATAAATSATNAGSSAAASLTSANSSATSATNALNQAAAALTSANNSAASATTATTQATNSATSATAAANSQAAAALSAAAAISAEADAIIAQGAAQTAATTATTQATAAALSATNALSSANSAATSATQSSSSATTAAGHASNASTSAGAAATSATNAQNSSTAASGSASTAATHATNAGNSATSANASSVSAASSYGAARLTAASTMPSDFSQSGEVWFSGFSGAPSAQTPIAANSVYSFPTVSAIGKVVQIATAGTNRDVGAIGAMALLPNRTYRITVRGRVLSTIVGSPTFEIYLCGLDADYASVTTPGTATSTLVANTWTSLTLTRTSAEMLALNANVAFLRPLARAAGASGSNTFQFSSVLLEDITESTAAATSATAAATSASAASTSAGSAGTSATAANTSATNAATSAGSASTSATSASNSATTATTAANTATTQAGLAATSATNAGNSATAANTSAGTAATHATNAGNSATAANTSAVNAASSYTSARDRVSSVFPEVIAADTVTATWTGNPASVANATVTDDAGFGPVWQQVTNGAILGTRGVVPAIAGRIYEVRAVIHWATVPVGQSPAAAIGVRSLDASYASVGGAEASSGSTGYSTGTNGTVVTLTRRFASTTPTGGQAWNSPGSAIWLRPYISAGGSATSTIRIRSLTIVDVTSQAGAENSATAAATSATSASTSATNAGNSATAASASAVSASSTFASMIQVTRNGNFDQAKSGWTDYGLTTYLASTSGRSNVLRTNAGVSSTVTSTDLYPVQAGANYRISIGFRVATGSNLQFYAGLIFYDATGTMLSASDGTGNYPLVNSASFSASSWVDRSVLVGPGAPTSPFTGTVTFPANTAFIKPIWYYNYNSVVGGFCDLDYFTIETATAEVGALSSATAAATSASSAATSATNAGTSATAASTSATNASTSAGNAGTSATNAANSATTATTQANNAATSASTAATHATNAGNSASAAGTSATTAGTHATNAGNSATAASTSAVNAASSYVNTVVSGGNSDFADGITGWSWNYQLTVPVTNMTFSASHQGRPNVIVQTTGLTTYLYTNKFWPVQAGRTYRIRSSIWIGSVAPSHTYIGMRALDSSGAAVTGNDGHIYNVAGGVTLATNQWHDLVSSSWTIATYSNNTRNIQLLAFLNYNATSGASSALDGIWLEDITESTAAAASATAAATSASSASTSATNAGTSATAASTSATNAATSAGSAGTSATNAANSATTATTQANNASTSASTAATHATNAGNSATAAGTSATTAGTHATNAGNSATAANTSAVNAASTYTNVVVLDGNTNFLAGTTGWTITNGGSVSSSLGGRSGVFTHATSGAASDCYTLKKFPIDPARKYKIKGSYWTGAGGSGSMCYIGFRAYNSAGAALTHNPGSYAYVAASGIVQAPNAGWVDYTSPVIVNQVNGSVFGYPPNTATIELLCLGNYNNSTTAWGLDSIILLDVTEAEAAATSATAAATSASSASTSAGAAGTSATSAATQATNAGVSAGNAATSASTASTQASNASASAASASSSAITAANLSGSTANILRRSQFFTGNAVSDYTPWTSGNNSLGCTAGVYNYSTSWAPEGEYPLFTESPNAPGGIHDWYSDVLPAEALKYYCLSAYVGILNASTSGDVRVFIEFLNAAGSPTGYTAAVADNYCYSSDGKQGGTSLANFKRVFAITQAPATTTKMRAYIRRTNMGASSYTWVLRPMLSEASATMTAPPPYGPSNISSSVAVTQTAVASLQAQNALARYEVSADTGGGTARLRLVSTTYGTSVLLDADKIFWGDNTVFDNAVDVLVTTTAGVARITALGAPFGTDGTLTQWEGPSSVAWGSHSRTNAHHYTASAPPYAGGSRRLVRTDLVETDAITKEYRSDSANADNYNTVGAITARTTIHYITIPTSGKKISFNAQFQLQAHHSQDNYTLYVVVERLLDGVTTDVFASNIKCLTANGDGYIHGWQMINFTDIPATSGSTQYSIRVYHTYSIGGPGNFTNYTVSHKSISIREHKTE